VACQVVDPATGRPHPAAERFAWKFHRQGLEHGLLVRPIGDCLYLMPPLATPPDRIPEAVATLRLLLDRL
jgi:adenosylmethionine-8-amino-7-oxononanoate aminotransferase